MGSISITGNSATNKAYSDWEKEDDIEVTSDGNFNPSATNKAYRDWEKELTASNVEVETPHKKNIRALEKPSEQKITAGEAVTLRPESIGIKDGKAVVQISKGKDPVPVNAIASSAQSMMDLAVEKSGENEGNLIAGVVADGVGGSELSNPGLMFDASKALVTEKGLMPQAKAEIETFTGKVPNDIHTKYLKDMQAGFEAAEASGTVISGAVAGLVYDKRFQQLPPRAKQAVYKMLQDEGTALKGRLDSEVAARAIQREAAVMDEAFEGFAQAVTDTKIDELYELTDDEKLVEGLKLAQSQQKAFKTTAERRNLELKYNRARAEANKAAVYQSDGEKQVRADYKQMGAYKNWKGKTKEQYQAEIAKYDQARKQNRFVTEKHLNTMYGDLSGIRGMEKANKANMSKLQKNLTRGIIIDDEDTAIIVRRMLGEVAGGNLEAVNKLRTQLKSKTFNTSQSNEMLANQLIIAGMNKVYLQANKDKPAERALYGRARELMLQAIKDDRVPRELTEAAMEQVKNIRNKEALGAVFMSAIGQAQTPLEVNKAVKSSLTQGMLAKAQKEIEKAGDRRKVVLNQRARVVKATGIVDSMIQQLKGDDPSIYRKSFGALKEGESAIYKLESELDWDKEWIRIHNYLKGVDGELLAKAQDAYEEAHVKWAVKKLGNLEYTSLAGAPEFLEMAKIVEQYEGKADTATGGLSKELMQWMGKKEAERVSEAMLLNTVNENLGSLEFYDY